MGWAKEARPAPTPAPEASGPPSPPSDVAAGFKDEMAWNKFRSTKGWLAESVATRMYDFIKHKGLFGELLAFSRRRR